MYCVDDAYRFSLHISTSVGQVIKEIEKYDTKSKFLNRDFNIIHSTSKNEEAQIHTTQLALRSNSEYYDYVTSCACVVKPSFLIG